MLPDVETNGNKKRLDSDKPDADPKTKMKKPDDLTSMKRPAVKKDKKR